MIAGLIPPSPMVGFPPVSRETDPCPLCGVRHDSVVIDAHHCETITLLPRKEIVMDYLKQLKTERENLIFIWGYLISFSARLRIIHQNPGAISDRTLGESIAELDEIATAVGATLGRVQAFIAKEGEVDGPSR
jgi:hypothetical protein